MRWQMGRRSDNIEDRRGMPVGRGAAVGGGIGTLVLVLLAMYFGVDPSVILQGTDPGDSRPAPSVQQRPAGDDQLREFVSVVLADTEDTWRELFQKMGRQYQEPKLVLFSGAVQSACGFAQGPSGPSTVRETKRSTSTCRSIAICASASGRPATSRRLT